MFQENENFHKISWTKIRKKIEKLDKNLCEIIDDLAPNIPDLYFARYSFGVDLLKDGILCLPNEKREPIPINDLSMPLELKTAIGYSSLTNPLSVLLTNTMELYIKNHDRVIPYATCTPGSILGIWKTLDNKFDLFHSLDRAGWGIASGAKSIFLLPKITEDRGHKRVLKQFYIEEDKPTTYSDHWNIFSKLCKSSQNDWCTESIFFSAEWIDKINTQKFQPLKFYLLNKAWENSSFWRNRFTLKILLDTIERRYSLKPSSFVADTTMHIFSIASGGLPAFSPTSNELSGPISFLQKIYADIYRLEYAPIIMAPSYFDPQNQNANPVYFSLHHNTSLELPLKSAFRSSNLSDLYDMYSLMKKYLRYLDNAESINDFSLNFNLFNVEFAHSETNHYQAISNIKDIFTNDPRLTNPSINPKGKPVPWHAPFMKGCVKISHKDSVV